ncbi:MAG: hypothetical protein DRI61_12430, partial [Chloroflexi bacterium]
LKAIKDRSGQKIDVEKFMKSAIKKETGKRDKKYWIEYFKARIYEIWKKNRILVIWGGQPPPYGGKKYERLYQYIEEEIEQALNNTVSQVLELSAMNQSLSVEKAIKPSLRETSPVSEVIGKPKTKSPNLGSMSGSASGFGGQKDKGDLERVEWLRVLLVFLIVLIVIETLLLLWILRKQVRYPLFFEVSPTQDGYAGRSGKYRVHVRTGSKGTPESVKLSIAK